MDVAEFCTQSNVVVVAGKGGVGKTTVTAALGLVAARAGLRVLVVGLDDQLGLPALFGRAEPLTYEAVPIAEEELLGATGGALFGQVITSEAALGLRPDATLAAAIRRRLALYKQQKAYVS
jgi:anion-transporting  ArsA/GET3 family ATPase